MNAPSHAWQRTLMRVAQGVIAIECAWVLFVLLGGDPRFPAGIDYRIVTHAASRWLGGGPFYMPYQLTGPYPEMGPPWDVSPIMYPPVALLLFVPFVFLPALLWWMIPAGAMGWAVWRMRPAWWAWPVMALLWLYPRAPEAVENGNPAMWFAAAVAVGCVTAGPAVLAIAKPTLLPFALVGINRRRWWVMLGLLVLASLPFLPLWTEYAKVVEDLRSPAWFFWHDWPLTLAGVVPSLSRWRS